MNGSARTEVSNVKDKLRISLFFSPQSTNVHCRSSKQQPTRFFSTLVLCRRAEWRLKCLSYFKPEISNTMFPTP